MDALVPSVVLKKLVDMVRKRSLMLESAAAVNRLLAALPKIRAIMGVAEALKMEDPSCGEWVQRFREAVEAAENVLDELAYKELEDEVQNPSDDQVAGSSSGSDAISANILERLKKAVTLLDEATAGEADLLQRADRLGISFLPESQFRPNLRSRKETSLVAERKVFGRHRRYNPEFYSAGGQPNVMTDSATAPAKINSADPPTAMTGSVTAPEEINSVDPCTDQCHTTESETIPMNTQLVNRPTATGTESLQDELKRIFQRAQAPLAVAALSLALLGYAPQSESIKQYLIFPYNAFFVMVWLSIFTSVGLTIYTFFKSTPRQDFAWFHKHLMIIATGSFLIAVML